MRYFMIRHADSMIPAMVLTDENVAIDIQVAMLDNDLYEVVEVVANEKVYIQPTT